METFGDRIKIIRDKLNMSQGEFAKRLDLKQAGVSLIESNKANMSKWSRKKLIERFNVNPDYLENGEEPIFFETQKGLRMSQFLKDIDNMSDNDIRKRMVYAMSQIPADKWQPTLNLIKELVEYFDD